MRPLGSQYDFVTVKHQMQFQKAVIADLRRHEVRIANIEAFLTEHTTDEAVDTELVELGALAAEVEVADGIQRPVGDEDLESGGSGLAVEAVASPGPIPADRPVS